MLPQQILLLVNEYLKSKTTLIFNLQSKFILYKVQGQRKFTRFENFSFKKKIYIEMQFEEHPSTTSFDRVTMIIEIIYLTTFNA